MIHGLTTRPNQSLTGSPKTVGQKKPFIFLTWLSQVFCYSDRKLANIWASARSLTTWKKNPAPQEGPWPVVQIAFKHCGKLRLSVASRVLDTLVNKHCPLHRTTLVFVSSWNKPIKSWPKKKRWEFSLTKLQECNHACECSGKRYGTGERVAGATLQKQSAY